MHDYVIKNVTVVDGSGKPPYVSDVCIKHCKISRIGTADTEALHEIDATGKVITPGFIDMHSHTDLEYLREEPPTAKILQGITTEVLGQDGLGVAPVDAASAFQMSGMTAGLLGRFPPEMWTWRSFAEYLETLERRGLPNNAAVLVSHGPLRILSMGMENRHATEDETGRMLSLLEQSLAEGAFGLSTGLIYPPCSYCSTEELIRLCQSVARFDGIFVVHQRDEGYYLKRSFREVISVAKQSGVHLHVSHLQANGKVNWPHIDDVLKEADEFVADGYRVTWDRYPYLAGSTVLTAALPDWTLSEGTEALIANLVEPGYRARIHEQFKQGLDVWNNRSVSVGWENIVISAVQSETNRWMQGKDCLSLAKTTGKHPVDFICDLLAEERLAVTMINHYGSPDVLVKVLSHPLATIGSDGIFGGRPHPRLYGTFPRFIKQFVNDQKVLSLPQAIQKATSLPASILGLSRRGLLKEGYHADLVIFDPVNIADTATYDDPIKPPMGIDYVFVNGSPVVSQSQFTGHLPGMVLRK